MKKRIMAFFVTLSLVLQCIAIPLVIETKAGDNESYAVAIPIVEKETLDDELLYSQKLSNFTTAFDYLETETSGFKLSYDYDNSLKKTIYFENFEDYSGDFATIQMENHGMVASVPDWETFKIAEVENDFSVTAFIALQNRDWGQMKLYLKEDLYLSLVGNEHGESALFLQLINRGSVISSFDLNSIAGNLHLIDSGSYIKVFVENAVVKVALSTDSTVSDDETVLKTELPADNFTAKNSIGIWQGNTGLYFDDVTIIDLTKSGYETEVTETYTYKEIYSENFDSDSAIAPENTTLVDDGNGGKRLLSAHWIGEALICNLSKNYSLEFSAFSKNLDWDNKFITLGNGIELHISGKMISTDGLYALRLLKDGTEIAKDTCGKYACEANNYFRIVYNNGLIEVYVSSSNKFTEPVLTATVDTSADSSEKSFKVYGGENLYIDNISVKDLDDYTVDVNTKTTGKYGAVQFKDGKIFVLEVNGSTETEKASADFPLEKGKKYRFAISRDKDKVCVSVDEKTILTADVCYDSENYMGELILNTSADISNIDVYDSGRITFTDGEAILNSYALSDEISTLAKSTNGNTLKFENNIISADITDVNGTVNSSAWLDEEAGDMVIEFDIIANRSDWVEDRFYFSVPGKINPVSGENYQWEPEKLYKNGYSLKFGAEGENSLYYNSDSLTGGVVKRLSSDNVSISEYWGNTTKTVRIVRKVGEIKVYLYNADEQPVLIEKITDTDHLKGNIYWYHRQGSSQISNISVFDTENYEIIIKDDSEGGDTSSDDTSSDDTSSDDEIIDDGKTELLKFYDTKKTDEKFIVNEPAVYEIEGPWYKITNPHANAMYLEKSFIDDVKVSDMDMSFTYYASGYWMTNEFYFGSKDKYGDGGFVLRVRGEGIAGDSGYNIELLKRNNGEYEQLDTANIPNITDGAYCFHITVKDGNITVNIRAKNANEEDAYILKGKSDGVYGGIYMYMYDDCTVRLRDIVIYKGTDTENAEKPDLSIEKETLLETDFSDGKAPVELFKEDTGVTLEIAEEKLHFNTNGNNYMQIGGFIKDDWLEDFTVEFDYLGHRGDWNIDRFGWHTERKDGDLYNSVYLLVLGSEVASDKNHSENYAKVEGANVQLISSQLGEKKCIGYASIPEINDGDEYTFRIAVNGGNVSVWIWEKGKDMPEKSTIEAFEPHPALSYGDFFVHAWSSDFSLDNMRIVNCADYSLLKGNGIVENKIPVFDGKTELLKFYNAEKTDEKLFVNEPATYEIEGPWYKVTNIHANAMYLEKSFIEDIKVSDMDMSFTYYASGYWMTNEFFFGSTDKYGRNGFVLRLRGEGTAGDNGYNVELLMNDNGKHKQLSTANIPNLTDGAYCFHITIKDGNITVNIRVKNAKEEDAYILKGESQGVYGGIYMYMYDDCIVRLRDIVIYKGTDIENAEKPDLSVKKETLLETDFSDGKAPVELFSEKDTGVTLEVAEEKLHFTTNSNHYMQIGGFVKNDWLEDFTAEFDYLGHRGDWNIDRFGWHTERKDGDLYNSVYLLVLGSEVVSDEKHAENYAKVEGANLHLISSQLGEKKCIGYASIPEISDGREYTFRIAVEGGNISVWAYPMGEQMLEKAVIKAFEPHPALSYGDFFVHAWCSDFSLDNMKIVNYADYTIPELVIRKDKEIGEIFRVDRIYEKIKEDKEEIIDKKPVVVEEKEFPILLVVIPAAVLSVAAIVFFIILIMKKRYKKI